MKEIAQLNFAPPGGFKGFGPLGNPTGTGITQFSSVISTTIGLMTLVAFIWFAFTLITGAIGIINSGGDKARLETDRKKITNGIIGIVIVISAVFLLDLFGTIFGIPFLNIFQLFYTLVPGGGNPGNLPAGF